MKRTIPFVKYTSYGNNFVIVDELENPLFLEKEKTRFANFATNIYFGVGSDNFLVIQRCTKEVLESINQTHGYWSKMPALDEADFIFRMFEPDGTEAFSCGNGLMCIARHLFRTYKLESVKIVTEIPTATPKVINIGTEPGENLSWANLGHPRKITSHMFNPETPDPYDDIILSTDHLSVTFRAHDLQPFSDDTLIRLKGYIVFTGEPHLVVFPEKDGILDGFQEVLFASSAMSSSTGKAVERRISFGTWLVERIGLSLNQNYESLFPAGMNVNFARPIQSQGDNIVEYRCFERGINRETLACGTGAVAVSYISKRLNLLQSGKNTVLPYRCRLHEADARIQVSEDDSGCRLYGNPTMLFKGEFELKE